MQLYLGKTLLYSNSFWKEAHDRKQSNPQAVGVEQQAFKAGKIQNQPIGRQPPQILSVVILRNV